MDIEQFTSKLMLDYQEKVNACQELLSGLRMKNRKLTREGKTVEHRMDVIAQIRELEAQRMAYLQAKTDIAAIQDHLGIG